MARILILSLAFLVSFYINTIQAALSLNLISDQCADPSGFSTCWDAAANAGSTCFAQNCKGQGQCIDENDFTSSNPDCLADCGYVAYAD
jgi:hypothetical protein